MGKRQSVQLLTAFVKVDRQNLFLELLEIVTHILRIRKFVDAFAPSIRNKFAMRNRSVPVVDRQ